jgi:RelE-like toxin of type II toxin-antitoxin system HigB
VNLHGSMSSLLQDRSPFMPGGFFYCGYRVHSGAGDATCRTTKNCSLNLALPGFGLHPLKGKLRGLWAVSVSGNWRIVFRFDLGKVYDVDLIDYH